MLDTSNSGGLSPFFYRLTNKAWPWLVFGLVGLLLAQVIASPSYAWWFTPTTATASVSPSHQRGLVIAPITQALVPQFILQPLSQTVVEQPPVAQSPIPTTPVAKPTVVAAKAAPPRLSPAVAAATTYSSVAQRILDLVNQQRAAYYLSPLQLNSALMASAQSYAEYMASAHFFSHTGLNGSKFTERNEAAGYTGWSWLEENIAYGQTSPEMVMHDWMESQEHRDNILNPHVRDLGVGKAGGSTIYWVQEFGAK